MLRDLFSRGLFQGNAGEVHVHGAAELVGRLLTQQDGFDGSTGECRGEALLKPDDAGGLGASDWSQRRGRSKHLLTGGRKQFVEGGQIHDSAYQSSRSHSNHLDDPSRQHSTEHEPERRHAVAQQQHCADK